MALGGGSGGRDEMTTAQAQPIVGLAAAVRFFDQLLLLLLFVHTFNFGQQQGAVSRRRANNWPTIERKFLPSTSCARQHTSNASDANAKSGKIGKVKTGGGARVKSVCKC